ncbi:MAG: hypothetical protein M1453_09430 [Acidobacteria bacterium]|nr:hypothetical protein [Acidobacteriota bacterium]MCL5288198.1 hypothetical protein [Acidobacteriota bacterium]
MRDRTARDSNADPMVCRSCGRQRATDKLFGVWYRCIVCERCYCPECAVQLPQPPLLDPERLCPHCSGIAKGSLPAGTAGLT